MNQEWKTQDKILFCCVVLFKSTFGDGKQRVLSFGTVNMPVYGHRVKLKAGWACNVSSDVCIKTAGMERQTHVWKMHGSVGFNESYKLERESVGKRLQTCFQLMSWVNTLEQHSTTTLVSNHWASREPLKAQCKKWPVTSYKNFSFSLHDVLTSLVCKIISFHRFMPSWMTWLRSAAEFVNQYWLHCHLAHASQQPNHEPAL